MTEKEFHVTDKELPALYQACDGLSVESQKMHFRWYRVSLLVLFAAAIVAALGEIAEPILEVPSAAPRAATTLDLVQKIAAAVAAIFMVVGLFVTNVIQSKRKAETWYDSRAIAESAKSMAWKFMMKAAPYRQANAEDVFRADLEKLLSEVPSTDLVGMAPSDSQIPAKMTAVRNSLFAVRLNVYRRDRIADQLAYYQRRSRQHAGSAQRWFVVMLAADLAALVIAIVAVSWLPAGGIVGLATTAAACCLAWTQLGQFSQLAHSYAFTSHEIGLLTADVNDDNDLARFVSDCEAAFSREHTMWRARREMADA
jgi:hypothetical protein